MPAAITNRTHECTICRVALGSERELNAHMCLKHDECGESRLGGAITFRCMTCGEGFSRRSDLFTHLQERGHGNPSQWDKPQTAAERRARRRPPRR
jgi:hypothetical protein